LKKPKNPPGLRLRLLAAERLQSVLRGANFAPFTVADLPEGRDRSLANRLVTTALRRHGHLDLVIKRFLERGMPKRSGPFEALLRIGLTQILFLPDVGDHSALFLAVEAAKRDTRSQHLAKLLNATLRRGQAEAARLRDLPDEALFPDHLRQGWVAAYGEDKVDYFTDALLDGAPLDLTLKDNDPDLIEALGASPVMADTVRVSERDKPVDSLPGYAEGRWWVQDAAAAIPARLITLAPGARVLDLCAAPGGKTAQLIKAGYQVTALDNDPVRMERLSQNLARLGYTADVVTSDLMAYTPEARFDAILLDAPCSATGTFRRHPEVIWHREAVDIAARTRVQRNFIMRAKELLVPGGTLVYCVCSLETAEGEDQAKWITDTTGLIPFPVQTHELPEFPAALRADGTVRTHPGLTVPGEKRGTLDGFFIARFRSPTDT
jgi:16S rRNA (cytosine967-C5)-methyltransferase